MTSMLKQMLAEADARALEQRLEETEGVLELLFEKAPSVSPNAEASAVPAPIKKKLTMARINTVLLSPEDLGFEHLQGSVYGVRNESPIIEALVELLGVPIDGTPYKIRNGFMKYDKLSKMLFIAKFKSDLPGVKKLTEGRKLSEIRNHLGEVEYTSFSSWKRACRKADPNVWFDGDVDICNAFIGHRPYMRSKTRAIGEWDGEKGVVFVEDPKKVAIPIDAPEDKVA